MFFATSVLHVHLMQWCDDNLVQSALNRCDQLWDSMPPDRVSSLLLFRVSFIDTFLFEYRFRVYCFCS